MKQKSKDSKDVPVASGIVFREQIKQNREVLLVASWLILWPIVMIGIVMGLGFLVYMFTSGDDAAGSSVDPRMAFFWFVTVLVLICVILAAITKRLKNSFFQHSAPVLRGYMWAGILMSGLILTVMPGQESSQATNQQTANSPIIPELKKDPQIVKTLQSLGATEIDKIETKYVSADEFDMKLSDKQGEYTYYTNPLTGEYLYGVLSVVEGLDASSERSTIAHEYLHHIWAAELDEDTKDNLSSHLITLYGHDPTIRQRTIDYSEGSVLSANELFAFYCTEYSDGYLTSYVLEQCSKYIDRKVLEFYF